MNQLKFILLGTAFGFVLTKAEVISWFRIQEMFRFQDFHMFGIIGVAIVVGIISVQIIKRFELKAADGNKIVVPDKDPTQVKRYIFGGLLFGFGWALTGACPGPLFALIGSGLFIIIVPLIAALAGTWVYGFLQQKLPH